jgi:hypothetical protein
VLADALIKTCTNTSAIAMTSFRAISHVNMSLVYMFRRLFVSPSSGFIWWMMRSNVQRWHMTPDPKSIFRGSKYNMANSWHQYPDDGRYAVVSYPTPTAINYCCTSGCWSYVAPTTLETYTRLMGKYELGEGGPLKRRFRIRGRILSPHVTIGSVSGSSREWTCNTEGPTLPEFIYTVLKHVLGHVVT